jgi:adenylylsulfate kinase
MLYPLSETISRDRRIALMNQKPFVIWLTGLSGSGKSTIATALEKQLSEKGFKTYLLDGDNLRSGLNKDLGFSENDRKENIRRIGEVCKLFHNAGLIVIASFISPFKSERDFVRSLLPPDDFAEVFVNATLENCESRDVKGLYKKARAGVIQDFTGISSPYERPVTPDVELLTDKESLDESLSRLMDFLLPRINII